MTAPRVHCPTCQREVAWSEQFPWRPFCSERCKNNDFGAWASEGYAVPANADAPPLDAERDDTLPH